MANQTLHYTFKGETTVQAKTYDTLPHDMHNKLDTLMNQNSTLIPSAIICLI